MKSARLPEWLRFAGNVFVASMMALIVIGLAVGIVDAFYAGFNAARDPRVGLITLHGDLCCCDGGAR